MLVTIFSKIFGFARDMTLSYFYGASNISDAFIISITIPSALFGIIVAGISTGYIPMYTKIHQNYGKVESEKFTSNLLNVLVLISTVIVIPGLLFTDEIVRVFASGFEGDTLAYAIQFTRISLIGIYFTGFVVLLNAYLQLQKNYIIPALIGFPLNFTIVASIFVSSHTDVIMLAIGAVLAIVAQLMLILPFVLRSGFRYTFALNYKDEHLKNMFYLSLPIILGVSIDQINTIIDKTIASRIAEGGISALNYASKLNGFVQGIFVVSIIAVMFPIISNMASEKNLNGLKKIIAEAIGVINVFVVPATIGLMVFAEPIVRLLFGRGAFDEQDVTMTSISLAFYSIGMLGYGLRDVLSRAFYALQDTKTPMINAAIAILINIILNLILSRYLGIGGLALATSISAIVATVLLFISLHKKIGSFSIRAIFINFMKILIASIIMGMIAKVTYDLLSTVVVEYASLIVSISLGAFVYFALIYFMKIEEINLILRYLSSRLKKIK